jgi:hypothetical protein
MAFPNSGTTYTIELIAAASNMSMATNYGNEQETHSLHKHYPNLNTSVLPVFTKGPFWTKPLQQHPTSVVLTKTHCGGYCHDCAPSGFTETPHSFLMHCASAKESTDSIVDGVKIPAIHYVYDYNEVDRAIHLIRDPFDNMVARFHYDATQLVRVHTEARAEATAAKDNATSMQQGIAARISKQSGVDSDAEMAAMVQLQNAYAANARVMSTAQAMWDALMGAVR